MKKAANHSSRRSKSTNRKRTTTKNSSSRQKAQPFQKSLFQNSLIKRLSRFRLFHSPKTIIIALLILSPIIYTLKDLPSPTKLNSNDYPASTLIFDRNHQLLYEIYADTNRIPVSIDELPKDVINATIAIEDQNFYHHFGFSLQGIVRAIRNNLFKNKLQGGSTITQQLVKTALLTPERTLTRKVKEAILTIAVEVLYSKNQILEMYLNHIPYGGTAYGIEAAAGRFFNKHASELTLPEAALLVGLPQAPTRYSPFSDPESAKARQGEVLRRMVEAGFIDQTTADQAAETPLTYAAPEGDIKAPHFVFYIKSLLEEKYGLQTVEKSGLKVTTTLDLNLQEYAQASLSAEIKSLEKYRVSNGAALVTNPATGEILSMVGSTNFSDDSIDGKVNIPTRPRQPGSSIKPLNYVTAFQTKRLTPASVLLDYPTCFNTPGQPSYCPKNYDGSFHGPVQVRYALANSYNIPAVKTLAINGLESMIATASAMGISTFTDSSRFGLSLTLGGGEVTMVDLATAFGTLANEGVKVDLHPILKVENQQGEILEEYHPSDTTENIKFFFEDDNPESNLLGFEHRGLKRVLNRQPAFLISDILADNTARQAAFGPNSALYIPNHTVSVKTGTTNDLKDNWTIGYTPNYLVATWVGNNDSKPMNQALVSGITGAAPIWHDIMIHLLKNDNSPKRESPPDIETTFVCKLSGAFPTDTEPCDTRPELFWKDNFPKTFNQLKKQIWVHKDSGLPAFFPPPAKPEEVDTTNLELKDHLVLSDPFVKEFCLDCPWPQQTDDQGQPNGKINYPVVNVNTAKFFFEKDMPSKSPL